MVNPEISRRKFLTSSALLIGASIAAKDLLLPGAVSADDSFELRAALPFERFYYRPTNLKEVFYKFRDAHFARTGEDIEEDLLRYVKPMTALTRQADGNCNGGSNDEVLKQKMLGSGSLGGIDFTKNEIKILTSALHYGDARVVENWRTRIFDDSESASPLFIHTLLSRMSEEGWGFVVDLSKNPNEMWSYPVDFAKVSWRSLSNGYIRVDADMSAPNYWDSLSPRQENQRVGISYEIQPNNPGNSGRFVRGAGTILKSWRPDPTRHLSPQFEVRGNVFSDSAVESLSILADYKV